MESEMGQGWDGTGMKSSWKLNRKLIVNRWKIDGTCNGELTKKQLKIHRKRIENYQKSYETRQKMSGKQDRKSVANSQKICENLF